MKISDINEGRHLQYCRELNKYPGVSLEMCKQKACQDGADSLNFKMNECYHKICSSQYDPGRFSTKYGGYDAYALMIQP